MTDGPRMTSRRVHNSSVSDNPTFPEFVDYLIRTPPNLMDKHWAPYTKVGKIEMIYIAIFTSQAQVPNPESKPNHN